MKYQYYNGLSEYENVMKNYEVISKKLNAIEQIMTFFPRLKQYEETISYHRTCHAIAELLGHYEESWDLEVQRQIPYPPYWSESNYPPFGKNYKCNYNSWLDNRLLFYPGVKFNGIDITTNMWVPYTNSATGKAEYYYVGEDYVGVTGWKFVDAWYYFNDFAVMQTGWLSYNNKWYYLHESGRMLTGVRWIGENYYALNPDNGELRHSGWIQDNGNWYYSHDVGGSLLRNTWYKIEGSYFYFNNDATMKKGWLKYNNYWYFLQDNGAMATGWKDIGESRYYFKTSGEMVTGVHVIGGVEYEFNSSGHLIRTGKKVNINPCDKYTCIYPYEDPTTVEEGER